ncbi:MAG: hypothetical protein KJ741_18860 [Proteobacteria bacterium]|nr:hypothetical protein [Pseudomonadota bacterium]
MPISDVSGYDPGHFGRVYEDLLKPAILNAGFHPLRADDTNKTDYIVIEIIQKVVNSAIVLCDFSDRNPNVMYELGIRQAFNLPATLIRDHQTEKISDIKGLCYTEYDETLCVDSVQKDIANGHLSGIKAAIVPDEQQVSPDTQLLLSVVSSLERKINAIDSRADGGPRFFRIIEEKVEFGDTLEGEIRNDVYDSNKDLIGKIVDIHPNEEEIFVKKQNGKVVSFHARSIKSKGLSVIGF